MKFYAERNDGRIFPIYRIINDTAPGWGRRTLDQMRPSGHPSNSNCIIWNEWLNGHKVNRDASSIYFTIMSTGNIPKIPIVNIKFIWWEE